MPGMQDIIADSFSSEAPGASQLAAAPAPVLAVPLLDDPNDDFCRVCGFGVSIMQISFINLHLLLGLTQAYTVNHRESHTWHSACSAKILGRQAITIAEK